MKRTLLVMYIIAMLPFARSLSNACECVQVGGKIDLQKWLTEFNGAVFAGQTTKIEEEQIPVPGRSEAFYLKRAVTFTVDKQWKGIESREVVVQTGIGGGDCGYPFVEGEKYFVIAHNLDGKLQTDICTSTKPLRKAVKDIKEFDEATRAVKTKR